MSYFYTWIRKVNLDKANVHINRFFTIGTVFILLILSACAGSSLSGRPPASLSGLNSAEGAEAAYREARSRWTAVIGPGGRGSGSRMMMPGLMGGGQGPGGRFPLNIRATLMHDDVIETGFAYYEETAQMTAEEKEAFRKNYHDKHETGKYIIIEASLRTSLAENYLDLSRYTIYLKDDRGNVNEPARITEMPVSSTGFEGDMDIPSMEKPMYMNISSHTKNVFLYFPRKDFYGNPTLPEDIRTLRLVLHLYKDGNAEAEGTWVFEKDR